MTLSTEVAKYLGVPYDFRNSPRIDLQNFEAINCQLTFHLLYKDRFGIVLPTGMWSKEIYEDENHIFRTITDPDAERAFEGDGYMFGREGDADPRNYHLTYFTGTYNYFGEPLFIHGNYRDRQVSIWPLSKFKTEERHRELKKVKRLQSGYFNAHVLPAIYAR